MATPLTEFRGSGMGDESFGTSMKRMRLAKEMSLRDLSRLAHFDYTYLSKVENGHRQPSEGFATSVDIALEADGVLIAMAQIQRVKQTGRAVTLDNVRRREFIAAGTVTAVASLSGVRDSTKRVGRVGATDVEQLTKATVRLRTLGHLHGGLNLWQAAEGVAREGYHLLEQGTYTNQVQDLLLVATGRAQMCAGWLAFDSGQQDVARSCYNEALLLARQTGNIGVEVHALMNLAHQSCFLGMPRQALRFAEAGDRIARGHDPLSKMTVVPLVRRASAFAIEGDRSSSERAMSDARRRLDSVRAEESETWVSFVSSSELDSLEAATMAKLGLNRRAEALWISGIADESDKFLRNRALSRIRLAATRLDLHEIEGAALAADQAVDDLAGEVESRIASAELDDVAKRLAAHRQVPTVDAFLGRYLASRS